MKLPGFWSDVVFLNPDRFALITGGAYDILCYDENGTLLWTQPTPQGMWYMRAAALPDGTIAMLGQGHQGGGTQIAIHYPDGTTYHAQHTDAFMWAQSIIRSLGYDSWELAIQTSPSTWCRVVLGRDGSWTPGASEAVPLWPGGNGTTSQGLAYFTDQGVPEWSDPNYVRVVEGETLMRAQVVHGLFVGQDPAILGIAVIMGPTKGRLHTDSAAYDPHVVYGGFRWSVCARSDPPGTALFNVLSTPFQWEPWEQPPDPIVVPPAPAHLKGCGYFFRDTAIYPYIVKYGGENPAAPGTHSVIIDDHGLPSETRADGSCPRMIVGLGQLLHAQMPSWWDRVDAVYVAVEGDELALANLVALAQSIMDWRHLAPKPVLTYSGQILYPAAIGPDDILGVQLYANRVADPVADLRAQAAAYWPQIQHLPRVAVIGQAYDRGGWFTDDQLAAIQPVIYEIACLWPNCVYLLWFSDARQGGTRDHEVMRPWHLAIADAIKAGP